ncbi:MAG: hypothetical protein KF845_07295 [Cyclobacteriaceae bacterium]|nr:hypothetical protein [Cyclobacteriaceae bacterium]
MKNLKEITPLLLTLSLVFTGFRCGEDHIEPTKSILGRWELVENSFGVVTNPSQYEEYLPDSVLLIYRYNEKTFYQYKYWFNDSLIFKGGIFVDSFGDTAVVAEPYKYKFISFNKLRMDFQYPAINTSYIYKRIK